MSTVEIINVILGIYVVLMTPAMVAILRTRVLAILDEERPKILALAAIAAKDAAQITTIDSLARERPITLGLAETRARDLAKQAVDIAAPSLLAAAAHSSLETARSVAREEREHAKEVFAGRPEVAEIKMQVSQIMAMTTRLEAKFDKLFDYMTKTDR